MLILQPSFPYLFVVAAVADATNLRQGQRHLQMHPQPDDYVASMLALVNEERGKYGLAPLCANEKLNDAAQRHSNDQATNSFMDHKGTDGTSVSDRITQANYDWNEVAENVAAGQANVESVMESWMNSPSHRENILGDYTMFGTAYAYNADSPMQYHWTQEFGSSSAEECGSGHNMSEAQNTLVTFTKGSEAEDTVDISSEDEPLSAEILMTRDSHFSAPATDASFTKKPIAEVEETEASYADAPVLVVDLPVYEVLTTEAPIFGTDLPKINTSGDNHEMVMQTRPKGIPMIAMTSSKTTPLVAVNDSLNPENPAIEKPAYDKDCVSGY